MQTSIWDYENIPALGCRRGKHFPEHDTNSALSTEAEGLSRSIPAVEHCYHTTIPGLYMHVLLIALWERIYTTTSAKWRDIICVFVVCFVRTRNAPEN